MAPPQKLSRGLAGRQAPVNQQVVVLPKPSLGKAILALVFFFLPLVGGGAFWKLREAGLKNVVTKLGTFGSKGLHKVYLTLRKQG